MADQTEFVFRSNGYLELRDRQNETQWIATNTPIECRR